MRCQRTAEFLLICANVGDFRIASDWYSDFASAHAAVPPVSKHRDDVAECERLAATLAPVGQRRYLSLDCLVQLGCGEVVEVRSAVTGEDAFAERLAAECQRAYREDSLTARPALDALHTEPVEAVPVRLGHFSHRMPFPASHSACSSVFSFSNGNDATGDGVVVSGYRH